VAKCVFEFTLEIDFEEEGIGCSGDLLFIACKELKQKIDAVDGIDDIPFDVITVDGKPAYG